MNILFVADPLEIFQTYKDTTFSMMREAQRRGHRVAACEPRHLSWRTGGLVHALVREITLTGALDEWFRARGGAVRALRDFDAVVMRKDPPFDSEYFYATHLLEQAQREGARVFNRPAALRDHPEKLAIMEFPQFISPTLVTRDPEEVKRFHEEHHEIILKPLDGMGGMGIFRVAADGLNLGSIIETLNNHGATTIMVQRFVPEIAKGDKRVLVIGGKPVPYSLARIPQGSEIRGNLAAGGKGVAQPLSARDFEIANALGPVLAERGLLLVGLDVIGDFLTEINVTSPTCFQEITQQTGFDVPAMFVEALEAAAAVDTVRPGRIQVWAPSKEMPSQVRKRGAVLGATAAPSPTRAARRAAAASMFVGRQRRGDNDRYPVARRREAREIQAQIFVGELRVRERMFAFDEVEARGAMRPQRLAVRKHEIERTMARNARRQFAQGQRELCHAGHAGMRLRQLLHEPAERALAIRCSHRQETRMQPRLEVLQVAVVREHPISAPQLAHERMAVLQRHRTLRRLADVRDDVAALDRIAPDELSHRRLARRLVIDEMAQAEAFEERDAPAVGVMIGAAPALGEAREAERHVGRRVAVHPEQLAHGPIVAPAAASWRSGMCRPASASRTATGSGLGRLRSRA